MVNNTVHEQLEELIREVANKGGISISKFTLGKETYNKLISEIQCVFGDKVHVKEIKMYLKIPVCIGEFEEGIVYSISLKKN